MTARSPRWLTYARWMAVDALWQRFALPFALSVLLTGFGVYAVRHQGVPADFYASPDGIKFAANVYRQAMGTFLPLGVFLGMNGLVSYDRIKGYFRFTLAKPVPVPGYYATAFVVHALVACLLAALLAALLGWFTAPQPVVGAMLACAFTFALMGSLLFLLSALTNLDGGVAVIVWLGTTLSRQVEPHMPTGHWLHAVVPVLPPTHHLDAVRDALYAGLPVPAHDAWHVVGYGLICFALGLVAARRLPLAR